jgi:4-diphosphocytidyl-2-C-methyl-D-erythritol kinase
LTNSIVLYAHAKINLHLRILGKRHNGYHELETIFQEVNLADRITMSESEGGNIILQIDNEKLPTTPDNLCFRAAKMLEEFAGAQKGVDIVMQKKIPIGAGLGGGSSDAAATLVGLNQLWKLNLTVGELVPIAARLGADVPFFLCGGCQYARGIGEKLKRLPALKELYILLVVPSVRISTRWAFEQLNCDLTTVWKSPKFSELCSEPVMWELFENDFEDLVFHTHPEVGRIKEELQTKGSLFASLSGSGSTVYGIFDKLSLATEAQLSLNKKFHTYLTLPIDR